jgi:hypothetical protein
LSYKIWHLSPPLWQAYSEPLRIDRFGTYFHYVRNDAFTVCQLREASVGIATRCTVAGAASTMILRADISTTVFIYSTFVCLRGMRRTSISATANQLFPMGNKYHVPAGGCEGSGWFMAARQQGTFTLGEVHVNVDPYYLTTVWSRAACTLLLCRNCRMRFACCRIPVVAQSYFLRVNYNRYSTA